MTIRTGPAPAFAPDRPIAVVDVPIDGRHEVALEVAAWLASVWAIPIRLLHVNAADSEPSLDLDREVTEATGRWPELSFGAETLDGDDVAATIAGEATATSLLVLSTDNANAWAFKNSVAERLVHQASGPLVLVGPSAQPPELGGDLVVAFDDRPPSVAALDAAMAMAPTLDRNLWLVRVVPEPLGGGDGDAADDGEHGAARPQAEADLERCVEGLDAAVDPRWEVIESNDPVQAIEGFAAQIGASFVVAGARRRDDATRTTMSSITMGLVANAGRPILVVGH